jgi:hypothetical protein
MRGEELRAALYGVRDNWARTTIQDDQDPAYLASEEEVVAARLYAGNPLGGMGAGELPVDAPARLRAAVERQRDLIELQNKTPGPAMSGAIAMIDRAIAHAVDMSEFYDCPCRVTIVGEFNVQPNKVHGGYKRISIKVDDASLG